MIAIVSIASVSNEDRVMSYLQKTIPELYLLQRSILESGVGHFPVMQTVRQIEKLARGSGFGKVVIYLKERQITQVCGEETIQIQEDVKPLRL